MTVETMVIHGFLVLHPPSKPLRRPLQDPPSVDIVQLQAGSSIQLCRDSEKDHQSVLIRECHVAGYKTVRNKLHLCG